MDAMQWPFNYPPLSPLITQDCGDEAAAQTCLSRLQDYGAFSKESARSSLDRMRGGATGTPSRTDSPVMP